MTSLMMDLKLDRAFGHLDVNRNGFVEHVDVLALAARMVAGFDESPTSEKGRALTAGFEQWWQSLLAAVDLDGDRHIGPKEWNTGMIRAFVETESGFDEHFRPLAQAAFDLADTNGDGTLSQAEFATWQKAFGTPPVDVREAFEHLDTDGDSTLSVDELVSAAQKYYTGKGHPSGDWLYGRIGS